MNKLEIFDELTKKLDKYTEESVQKEKNIINRIQKFLKIDQTQDVIYNKTHKIINISNIMNYEIEYPSKINLHVDFIDINQQMHDITITTKSQILNNQQELIYYINLYIKKMENSYEYLQSNLENN